MKTLALVLVLSVLLIEKDENTAYSNGINEGYAKGYTDGFRDSQHLDLKQKHTRDEGFYLL